MLRETVKWDYELKMPDQVPFVVDRALSLAMSEPKGPVYVTLPREILAMSPAPARASEYPLPATRSVIPEPGSLAEAAAILARAKRPVIITASLGTNIPAVLALNELAERYALPVVSHVPKSLCLPTNHPMHLGHASAPFVKDADAILVLECDIPWIPAAVSPPSGVKVIHMGVDPLFADYALRHFPCHLAVAGDPALALALLSEALAVETRDSQDDIETRRRSLGAIKRTQRVALEKSHESARRAQPIHPTAATRMIDAVRGEEGILINELGLQIDHLNLTRPGTYFQQSSAGGLG